MNFFSTPTNPKPKLISRPTSLRRRTKSEGYTKKSSFENSSITTNTITNSSKSGGGNSKGRRRLKRCHSARLHRRKLSWDEAITDNDNEEEEDEEEEVTIDVFHHVFSALFVMFVLAVISSPKLSYSRVKMNPSFLSRHMHMHMLRSAK